VRVEQVAEDSTLCKLGYGSSIVAPIQVAGRTWGLLAVASVGSRVFGPEHEARLTEPHNQRLGATRTLPSSSRTPPRRFGCATSSRPIWAGSSASNAGTASSRCSGGHNQPRHHAHETRAEVKASLGPRGAAHLRFAKSRSGRARRRRHDVGELGTSLGRSFELASGLLGVVIPRPRFAGGPPVRVVLALLAQRLDR
jgi:hypothetical protein